jgi:hypothetical protein
MRRVLVALALLGFCLSLCGCDSSSDPCKCSQQNAVTAVWAYHEDELALATASRDGATWLNGVVFADPLPTLQSVDLNDAEFSDPRYWHYIDGYIYIGDWYYAIVVYSGFDPIEVAVRTSAGDVEGAVSLPDEITHLEFSESEVLELGEPLTISWPGQDADFYYFGLYYEWGDWEYSAIDTVLSGNSVTIEGSFFSHDGVIWDVWIQPTNGPVPQPGATGNMSGYGSGYLYYSRDEYYEEVGIPVGQGPEREARRSIARSSEERRATAQRTIRRMLGLPVRL